MDALPVMLGDEFYAFGLLHQTVRGTHRGAPDDLLELREVGLRLVLWNATPGNRDW